MDILICKLDLVVTCIVLVHYWKSLVSGRKRIHIPTKRDWPTKARHFSFCGLFQQLHMSWNGFGESQSVSAIITNDMWKSGKWRKDLETLRILECKRTSRPCSRLRTSWSGDDSLQYQMPTATRSTFFYDSSQLELICTAVCKILEWR